MLPGVAGAADVDELRLLLDPMEDDRFAFILAVVVLLINSRFGEFVVVFLLCCLCLLILEYWKGFIVEINTLCEAGRGLFRGAP